MFEAWNEPNASFFLFPQRNADGSNYSPALYREMVNRFATGVHRVHADNVVVAGAPVPVHAEPRRIARRSARTASCASCCACRRS